MRKIVFLTICMIILLSLAIASQADIIIPEETTSIESEAFMNDISISIVRLPDNLLTIRSKAFAYSSIRELYTSEKLSFIATDAFEGCEDIVIYGITGSYTDNWCQLNKIAFIPIDTPEPITEPIVLKYSEVNPIGDTIVGQLASTFKTKVEEI